ncbi:MAG: hypothetical protein OEY38_05970 [Gammaproteobacteria bacterium]|nr:hypothetical protein [Gammaproteobacteria bacterium]
MTTHENQNNANVDHKYWIRLEPRCRADDFSNGLEARIADPLWMLTRQWQTGEFTGEDAGSPIEVLLEYSTQKPEYARLGNSESRFAIDKLPLETIVEQEQYEPTWRERIQIAQQFEQIALSELASDAYTLIHACRKQFPLVIPSRDQWVELDYATRRMFKMAEGKIADGKHLLQSLANKEIVLPSGITESQVRPLIQKLQSWCKRMNITLNTGKPSAWRNQQLDYRFEINPPDEDGVTKKHHLIAPDYRNGDLDWYSFNIIKPADNWQKQEVIKTLPNSISIGGTSQRWWAFEDGATNFGKMDVNKPDLAKLLLMEFVLVYGDDWFSVPLPVEMPNLVKINNLKVNNVFGEEIIIPPARSPDPDPMLRFELFTLSPADPDHHGICDTCEAGTSNFLFIPPIAAYREESKPLEEIRFLRDEGANKVWGVEHHILNGLGRPIDGFDAQRERVQRRKHENIIQLQNELMKIEHQLATLQLTEEEKAILNVLSENLKQQLSQLTEGPKLSNESIPRYRLSTTVPDNWIPFAPVNASPYLEHPGIRLRRAQMLRNNDDDEPTPITAMSRLLELEEDPLLWLEEATVPRSGLRVQLTDQRVRWIDGKTYVWSGRKVTTGRGEGSSGLRFDYYNNA